MARKIEIDIDVDSSKAVKGVDDLSKSTDKLTDSTENLTGGTADLGESLEGLGGGFSGAISGAKALGKQFVALIANPIGLVIAAITVVLGTLFKAFSRTEEGGNKLNKGMNALTGVFNAFMQVIEPIASFLVDTFAAAFNHVGNEIDKFVNNLTGALKVLGFDDAAKGIDNLVNSSNELIAKTNELSDLEAKLLKTRREQGLIEKQALFDAEKLRQQRDDESNSLQERIEFNRQLGDVLQKQSKDELAIANDALRAAQLKLEIDGKTTEALDGLAAAQLEILDIQERINGQQTEQLANENSLRNEGIAAAKERAAIRKAAADEEKKIADEEAKRLEDKRKAEQEALDASINAEIESIQRGLELKRNLKLQIAEEGLDDANITPEQIRERAEAARVAREEVRLAEMETIQANFEADLISDEEREALVLQANKNNTDAIIALNEKEAASVQALGVAKDEITQQNLDSATTAVKTITGLAGESAEAQAAGIIAENAAGIAKMVISNNIANAGALATPQAIATGGAAAIPTITANNISTGVNIAASIAATAKGLAALKKGGSAGIKLSLSGGGGGGSASAPSLNEQTLFSTQDLQGAETETIGEGAGINQIKAVVVESDITNAQKKIDDIETSSEIG